MQAQDKETLLAICLGELPPGLEADYELFRAGWERARGGSVPVEALVWLAMKHGGIKVNVAPPSDWSRVEPGTEVLVYKAFNPHEVYGEGVFLGIVDHGAQIGLLLVDIHGEQIKYPEKRVKPKSGFPKLQEEKKPIPVDASLPVKTPEEALESKLLDDDLEDEAEEVDPVEATEGVWAGVKKKTLVDVATDGGVYTGEFLGVGGEKECGMLCVKIPALHVGKDKKVKRGWYDPADVMIHKDVKLPCEQVTSEVKQDVKPEQPATAAV